MHDYAAALIAARRGTAETAHPPAGLPGDYASAMRVQREVITALGAAIAGWKIGFAADATPVAGPLYASGMQASASSVALPARGFIVEIELAFRLKHDLPPRAYTRDEIVDAAGEALIGIELIHGRRGEPPDVPYFAFLADNIGNAGYVTGDASRSFQSLDLTALPMTFSVDGELVQEGRGGHPQGDPVEPLRAYASCPNDELGGLKAGQLITTGSLTKPLRIARPGRIQATLEGIGRVSLDLIAA